MTSRAITNSLLRLDGVVGSLPAPFERPNEKMDFFVLELGLESNVDRWCGRTAETLRRHADLLRQARASGATLSLFVESARSVPVIRFTASFLAVLAVAGISLECSYGTA